MRNNNERKAWARVRRYQGKRLNAIQKKSMRSNTKIYNTKQLLERALSLNYLDAAAQETRPRPFIKIGISWIVLIILASECYLISASQTTLLMLLGILRTAFFTEFLPDSLSSSFIFIQFSKILNINPISIKCESVLDPSVLNIHPIPTYQSKNFRIGENDWLNPTG